MFKRIGCTIPLFESGTRGTDGTRVPLQVTSNNNRLNLYVAFMLGLHKIVISQRMLSFARQIWKLFEKCSVFTTVPRAWFGDKKQSK